MTTRTAAITQLDRVQATLRGALLDIEFILKRRDDELAMTLACSQLPHLIQSLKTARACADDALGTARKLSAAEIAAFNAAHAEDEGFVVEAAE
jgi:hypothetical protein